MMVGGSHCLPSKLLAVSSKVVELSKVGSNQQVSLHNPTAIPDFSGLAMAVGSIGQGARQTLGFGHIPPAAFWLRAAQGVNSVCKFLLSCIKSQILSLHPWQGFFVLQ